MAHRGTCILLFYNHRDTEEDEKERITSTEHIVLSFLLPLCLCVEISFIYNYLTYFPIFSFLDRLRMRIRKILKQQILEHVDEVYVGGGHGVVAQSVGAHPLGLLALAGADDAVPHPADIERHEQVEIVVTM